MLHGLFKLTADLSAFGWAFLLGLLIQGHHEAHEFKGRK